MLKNWMKRGKEILNTHYVKCALETAIGTAIETTIRIYIEKALTDTKKNTKDPKKPDETND